MMRNDEYRDIFFSMAYILTNCVNGLIDRRFINENDIDLMQLEDLGTPLKLGTEGFVRELQNVPIINSGTKHYIKH